MTKFSDLAEVGNVDNTYMFPVVVEDLAQNKKTLTPTLIDLINNAEVAHSSTATLTSADLGKTITLSGASFTLTIMTAAGVAGRVLEILVDEGAAGVYTIDGSGSETINGGASYAMAAGDYLKIRSDGTNWQIVERVGLVYVYADSNAGQAVTATTTNLEYEDNIIDVHGAWTSFTTFTASRLSHYTITAFSEITSALNYSTLIYKNGTQALFGMANDNLAFYPSMATITLKLDIGDTINIRGGNTATRNSDPRANKISIVEVA